MSQAAQQGGSDTAALALRVALAICLLLESALMVVGGVFVAGLSMFVGALAFVSHPPATNEKFTQGVMAIGVTMVAPFVMAAVVMLGGFLLLFGKGKHGIIAAGVTALLCQLVFHVLAKEPLSFTALIPAGLHTATIAAAFKLLPRPRQE